MLVLSVFLALEKLLKFCAWFHFSASLWLQYCCIYLIFLYTTSGEYFISSMLIWSIPGLLLFFRVYTAFLISDDVNSILLWFLAAFFFIWGKSLSCFNNLFFFGCQSFDFFNSFIHFHSIFSVSFNIFQSILDIVFCHSWCCKYESFFS